MAQVRVPSICAGMTLTTSGAVVATNNIITCTATEATSLTSPYGETAGSYPVVSTNASTGAVVLALPSVITNITIDSVGYAVTNGITAAVPSDDATNFILQSRQRGTSFELVIG